MKFGSLFAGGMGGFDLGLERAGMECAWQVEIDERRRKMLEKNWPDVKRYGDVRNVGKHNLETVDLICGGFPCQPHSEAGKQKGAADDRDLWPEYFRVVSELKPTWVIGENVVGIIKTMLGQVLSDLESIGYDTTAFDIPACGFGANHRRRRIFIIAHSESKPVRVVRGERGDISAAASRGREIKGNAAANVGKDGWEKHWERNYTGARVGRVDDGVPGRVERLGAIGDAVVPQIIQWIGENIMEVEHGRYSRRKR